MPTQKRMPAARCAACAPFIATTANTGSNSTTLVLLINMHIGTGTCSGILLYSESGNGCQELGVVVGGVEVMGNSFSV